jgi:hypothetical protein
MEIHITIPNPPGQPPPEPLTIEAEFLLLRSLNGGEQTEEGNQPVRLEPNGHRVIELLLWSGDPYLEAVRLLPVNQAAHAEIVRHWEKVDA